MVVVCQHRGCSADLPFRLSHAEDQGMDRDENVLTGDGPRSNYATDENLRERQSIFAYLDPATTTGGSPIERAPFRTGARVLDVGCGNGLWLSAARQGCGWAVGLDLSLGMLEASRVNLGADLAVVQADAEALPLASGTAKGILAMHMLYHVPHLERALEEICRVLAPGGWALVTTNSGTPTRSAELYHQAVEAVTGNAFDYFLPLFAFDGASAPELLAPFFAAVEPAEHVAGFKVTDADALVGPLNSVRGPVEETIGVSPDWEAAFDFVRRQAQEEIDRVGAYRYEQHVFSFICRTASP